MTRILSGSWQMQHAGSRRPWRRRPRPNCPCPSQAECPGTARPHLLATPAATWRHLSHPPSLPPPPSAAAHPQVWQVCVCVEMCEKRKDGLLLCVEWMEVLKVTNANDLYLVTEKAYSYGCAIRGIFIQNSKAASWWANEDICNLNGMYYSLFHTWWLWRKCPNISSKRAWASSPFIKHVHRNH